MSGGRSGIVVGRAGRVKGSTESIGSQGSARKGFRTVETSTADPVDGDPKLEILGEAPSEASAPGLRENTVTVAIRGGERALGRVRGAKAPVTDALADERIDSGGGPPLLTVATVAWAPVSGRRTGAR